MSYLSIISLAEAKNYLRVDDTLTADDDQITNMINSALKYVEDWTNIILYAREKSYIVVGGSKRVYDYPINSVIKPSANVYASGAAQCTSAIAGDELIANGLTYTAVSGDPADDTEFSIGTDAVCAASLARAINLDTRTGTLGDISATSTGDTVTTTSNQKGYLGNAVTLTQTGGTITVSGATFSGGLDGGFSKRDIIKSTSYTTYCYSGEDQELILNVGYITASDVPTGLVQAAYELIDLWYYEKQTGNGIEDLSDLSRDTLNKAKRFIF